MKIQKVIAIMIITNELSYFFSEESLKSCVI